MPIFSSNSERERETKIFLREIFNNYDSKWGRVLGFFLIALISLSIFFFIVENTETWRTYQPYFHIFDFVLLSIFSIEYLIRLYIAPRKASFVLSPLAIIDLLVILTLCLTIGGWGAIFRTFRVFKILQLLKVFRHSEALVAFFRSFKNYKNELKIFGIILFMVVIFSSTGLYYLERGINPKIDSILDSLWWAITTISSVGYGDIVPITGGGKVLAGIVMFMGLGVLAIFTAIVTKMFIDHFFGKRRQSCVRCRYPLHDFDAKFCKNCGNALN